MHFKLKERGNESKEEAEQQLDLLIGRRQKLSLIIQVPQPPRELKSSFW